MLKRGGIALLIILVGIQVIPTRINESIPESSLDLLKTYEVPEVLANVLTTSCYDCHSNNTKYPWYSKIQPISLLLENHIYKGKAELNLSEFGSYSIRKQKSKLSSMIKQIENKKMPMYSYTLVHKDAIISNEHKKILLDYLNKLKKSLD